MILGGELLLEREARQRQRRPSPRQQRANTGQRFRKATLGDRRQCLLDREPRGSAALSMGLVLVSEVERKRAVRLEDAAFVASRISRISR
jgi:hypothetical protein